MSDKSENVLKKATKEWAKDYWLITPWNILAFFTTLGVVRWLCNAVGQSAYGTTVGNFQLSGIMLLAAVVAAVFIVIGSALFKVKEEEQKDAFWWTGTWIMIGIAGCFTFSGRAVLILLGAISPGSTPPSFLQWVFDPLTLEWLDKLGNP